MEAREAHLRRRRGLEREEDPPSEEGNTELDSAPDLVQWTRHMEVRGIKVRGQNGQLLQWQEAGAVKTQLLEGALRQLTELLDQAVWEAVQSYPPQGRPLPSIPPDSLSKTQKPSLGKQKVFIIRKSLLDELMEIQHFRTIYHMFIAGLCVFIISTLAIDFIDEGRLVLELDLLIFSFGQLPLTLVTWVPMFLSTLLAPYQALRLWARPRAGGAWTLGAGLGCVLLAVHTAVLGALPLHVAVKQELPPASRCILVFEQGLERGSKEMQTTWALLNKYNPTPRRVTEASQVRFLMKSYSFLREAVPRILQARGGEIQAPSFSSYLYFLFCPTLIYRDNYPRTPHIRWNYVAKNFAQALGCVLYACFILSRLCVPVFANMSREPFSTRALVLSILHATLPGIFMLLLIFFAFLHCWLNAFAEMLRFGDRMFYRDWWNSTSFSNYYRTWNVVVHDWLYSYVYQDGLWLLGGRARGAAMLGVFLVSALVHEYIFCFVLGFFYPVMLMLFLVIGGPLNFAMHDRHTGPAWNVLMWTLLFLGQGIQVSLYCQEWYARRHCPLPQTTFWGLMTPRSWSCRT
ncbi:sterol O-acyltransferase 2 isoform X3 [Choloepus didactylus]|uniref:sterol O-acyltransferase 2 isoform X3 n=1 Tax=Choloepus didactylus TaxID=27675 RepID=UPI0018A00A6C|nr:sterol O-acyltransferase 2 isoform X3 [Choloepus didactylus]